ncbi:MAG TPA: glycosyltransferase family protein [Vicinamibacterales bacterium]|nr:glycosyltransferase family protein [Vicinamibacterales bacterium]
MSTVAIIQARMSSTRLPGKVLAEIAGEPMLALVSRRVRSAKTLDQVVIATSTSSADDAVEAVCRERGIAVFRGSEEDVLDRYRGAAEFADAATVVRVTADCPLIDPQVIDLVVDEFRKGGADYVSNTIQRTYPDGLDTEVMSRAALERAWSEAVLQSEREHVTPYIWKHPELFPQRQVVQAADLSALRWTVDEPRDLELVREVCRRLPADRASMQDILVLLAEEPSLRELNAGIVMNEGYLRSLMEDRVIGRREEA